MDASLRYILRFRYWLGARSTMRRHKDLPRPIGEVLAKELGGDLIALDYEKDDKWIDKLGIDPAPFNLPSVTENMPTYVQ